MSDASQPLPRAVVADIGATNARFAVADLATLELTDIQQGPCAEHGSLHAAMRAYLANLVDPPRHAVLAVAGPVTQEDISLTNLSWSFGKSEFCRAAGFDGLLVLNDFEALAHSLPHLAQDELHRIGGVVAVEHAPKLVLGPGTGLGVAGLVWSGDRWIAMPGEGGHATLGADNARELDLIERLRQGRGHVSTERALSGPGLADLHQAIAASRGEIAEPLAPNDVIVRGLSGEDATADEALDLFVAWLGRFAGDAALLLGARGGVYIGGGIAPKILPLLTAGAFREAFEAKGRMQAFLAPIPIYVILAEFAALKGAAASLRTALATGARTLSEGN
jgi:glucokinase